MSDEDFAIGSVGISDKSHELLVNLVFSEGNSNCDQPFFSIVEAFRFAFSIGYNHQRKAKREGKQHTVAPRQFVVTEYLEILRAELLDSGQSLGACISDYAEGGCALITENMELGHSVLSVTKFD